MKISNLFKLMKGDTGLTDEYVYQSLSSDKPLIPLYGGNATHVSAGRWVRSDCTTKSGIPIHLFSGKGIILSLDGSAGSMTYKDGETFALNHHAGFLTPLKGSEQLCDLRFFAIFFQNRLKALSVSGGSKTLSKAQLNEFEFSLPDIVEQRRLVDLYQEVTDRLSTALKKYDAILGLLNKQVSMDYEDYQARDIPINRCIACTSGNSGLTEELIYLHSWEAGERYEVLSASTSTNTAMGSIPMCKIPSPSGRQNLLKTFCNTEGLLVVRKGKAGGTRYLPKGHYAINDDAYILSVKEDCPYMLDLRWLAIAYKSEFLSYSSSADNGTWNKTGFFSEVSIDIPSIEEQRKIVAVVKIAEKYSYKLRYVQRRLNDLLCKEIDIEDYFL